MDDKLKAYRWVATGNELGETPTYVPVAEFNATNGEFWVNAFREGYSSHNGASSKWYEAYLSAPRARQYGVVKNAGMWTRGTEAGVASTTFTVGTEIEPDYWLTGHEVERHAIGNDFGPIDIAAIAFFIDVLRPDGRIVRLWLSRGGRNYTIQEALDGARYTESLGPTSFRYAAEGSPIFAERPT